MTPSVRATTALIFLSIFGLILCSFTVSASAATFQSSILQTPRIQCVSGAPTVTLTWSTVSGARSYSVFKIKNSTSWQNISSRQTAITLTDKNISSGSTYQYQIKTNFRYGVSYSNIISLSVPNCTTTPPTTSPPPAPPPAPTPPAPTTNEITFEAYITGYGWPDNTPASAEISDGVIHASAGGVGTFTDPITIAVGHSILNGKDILDYPKGTKFYIPALRRFFIVEDTCGDGNTPQNGPCHTGYQGRPWLDAWVGGQNANTSNVIACEEKITNIHTVIQNPRPDYVVVSGPIFNGTCTTIHPETASLN